MIPTFNRAKYLGECLESILNQTLEPAQVLIVNDGSTDDTASVLESYRGRVQVLLTNQLGKAGALNHGLRAVEGDYLWIFDDDDVALPDALERLARPLEENPEYGFSYAPFYFTNSNSEDDRIGRVTNELKFPSQDIRRRGLLLPVLEFNWLGGAALFARKSCYDSVGGFDLELVRSQDYEMAIRLIRKYRGFEVGGGPTFHYRQHQELRGSAADRFQAGKKLKKWLEYDQKIFKKIHTDLSLTEYLPAPMGLSTHYRQALMQRMVIMGTKFLMAEAVEDLKAIAAMDSAEDLNADEKQMIRSMVEARYQRGSNLLDQQDFPKALCELRTVSENARILHREICFAIYRRVFTQPSLWRVPETLRRLALLHGVFWK